MPWARGKILLAGGWWGSGWVIRERAKGWEGQERSRGMGGLEAFEEGGGHIEVLPRLF